MGQDCCHNKNQPDELPASTSTIEQKNFSFDIFGDYFDRDTRALLTICDMAELKPNLRVIDTFNGSNLETSYTELNSTGTIPMIGYGFKK